MDAYLVVEQPIRRKLEEMLHTWKQPVPGSTSSQPVFASEMTRKIDNALIKARTAALQHQQKHARPTPPLGLDRTAGRTPPPAQFRNTPPPPPPPPPPAAAAAAAATTMVNGNGPYTNGHGFDYGRSASGTPINGITVGGPTSRPIDPLSHTVVWQQSIHQNASPAAGLQQLSLQGTPPAVGSSIDTLQSDILRLIDSCQTALTREPHNLELPKRLQALVDLMKILQTQKLPEAQLALVRDQVRALANPTPPPPPPPPPVVVPPPPPQLQHPLTSQDLASLLATAAIPFPAISQPPALPLPVSLPPAPLLAPPPPPPPPPPASPAQPHMGAFGPNGGINPASFFASLQKAGLLPNFAGGIPPPPPPPPPIPSAGGVAALPFPLPLPGNLPRNIMTPPPASIGTSQGLRFDWRTIDVEMKSVSLKM